MTPFGEFLEQLRRSRHLQQKQMADLMGINPCYVSTMEKGRKGPPSKHVLEQLVKKLQMTPDEQAQLWRSVELSELTYKLPVNMSKEEFELMYEIRARLGALSRAQITIIQNTLMLGSSPNNRLGGETKM